MTRKIHGHSGDSGKIMSPTYISWTSMKQRCLNPKQPKYKNYGGKGATVCDRWKNSFMSFLEDMGERPEDKTLDRIDGSGNYEPSNCRWATQKEQNKNKIKSFIFFNGEKIHYKDLCFKYRVRPTLFKQRINKGFTVKQSLGIDEIKQTCKTLDIPDISKVGKIRWLREKGCTMEDIGKHFGVSRQRIYQILN
jgi:hypothetical protein